MSDIDKGLEIQSDEALESLLKKAGPRRMPPAEDAAAVRRAVKAEWRAVTGKRRRQVRVMQYAMAATVVLGVFAIGSMLRAPIHESVQVASIEKSFGAIYLLGESDELRETRNIAEVYSGQTIVTDNDAGLALAWGSGGSLRVDENSRVEFVGDHGVYLRSGRIYFDSTPSAPVGGVPAGGFAVRTDHGDVTHVGTQFMTRTGADELVVSVREGEVSIDGRYHDYTASPGEQVTLAGRQSPAVLNISRSGDAWAWVSRTTPPADFNGKPLRLFLHWASRELGLQLEYEGGAERAADELLKGTIDLEPAEALPLGLATFALSHRIEGDVLYVSDIRP